MDCCVITLAAYCGHPFKGGMQSASKSDPSAVRRLKDAKAFLAHAAVDKRKR